MNSIPLSSLAIRINDTHKAVEEAPGGVLSLAIEVGDYLFRAKEQVPIGQWQSWLRENIKFSKREAQIYMQLFRYREEIKNVEPALMTIDAALARITRRQPVDEELSTEIAGIIHLAYMRMESTVSDLRKEMENGNLSDPLVMRVLRHDCGFERVIARIDKQVKEAAKAKKSISYFAESMLQVAKEYIQIARDWRSKHAPYAVDLDRYYRFDAPGLTGHFAHHRRSSPT
jgi:tetratricopeptide (TPR) repeat protein